MSTLGAGASGVSVLANWKNWALVILLITSGLLFVGIKYESEKSDNLTKKNAQQELVIKDLQEQKAKINDQLSKLYVINEDLTVQLRDAKNQKIVVNKRIERVIEKVKTETQPEKVAESVAEAQVIQNELMDCLVLLSTGKECK